MNPQAQPDNSDRRGFFSKLAAVVVGGVAGAVPAVAGLAVFLDPLRRKAAAGATLRVTTLEAVPNDGIPRKFSIIASRADAWNRFPNVPVGAVYLRRTGDQVVQAFNVVCPHAGCFVDFIPNRGSYVCPCHNSTFNLDGSIHDPRSPSPRGLDALEVELRNGTEVWVKFQNFRAGIAVKVPVA